jgi:putative glycosyltransferase
MKPMTISIVTSLYRSGPYVYEFYHRTLNAIDQLGLEHEFIFVDDGSPDDSAARIMELRRTDCRVHLLRLSRNCGQQRAIMAGLRAARGDYVFLIDVDLDERPEELVTLYTAMAREAADVAFGVMERRQGGFMRRMSGWLFQTIITRLSSTPIPRDELWARVMTRRYLNAVRQYGEEHVFLGGVFQLAGFRQVAVPVAKSVRDSSSYSFNKRVIVALDAITSFSGAPLFYVCLVGAIVVALCVLLTIHLIVQRVAFGIKVEGGTTVAVLVVSLIGFVIFAQGLVGIYVGKIFEQVKGRPLYIVESSTIDDEAGSTRVSEVRGRIDEVNA